MNTKVKTLTTVSALLLAMALVTACGDTNKTASGGNQPAVNNVITSYSIHYTKLYDRNVVAAMIDRYPLMGRSIAILYMFFLLLLSAGEMRICVDFTNSSLLNRTPIVVIGLSYNFV